MTEHKLIFAGPVGAGKTTAIQALSDSPGLNTDAPVSDATSMRKATTTVAMDYGYMTFAGSDKLHLYGTPGQTRFRFMWELLAENLAADCAGLVILLDNTRNSPYRDLKYYVQEFSNLLSRKPLVIGVTRADLRAEPGIERYREWVAELGLEAEVHFVDGRRRADLARMLSSFLANHIPAERWQPLLTQDEAELAALQDAAEPAPEIAEYLGDNITMKDSIVDDLLNIKGVQGAVLADAMGDIITSSLDDSVLDDFIGFMAGMVPVLEQASDFGQVRSVVLKSDKSENLSVFVEEAQVLGVLSGNRASVRILHQQIDDLLQWS